MKNERIECPYCHKMVSNYVPKAGDGSDLRLRSHKNLFGRPCLGRFQLVEANEAKAQRGEG